MYKTLYQEKSASVSTNRAINCLHKKKKKNVLLNEEQFLRKKKKCIIR